MNSMIVTMTQPIEEMNLMERGLYFGYPACCVLQFCRDYAMSNRSSIPDSKFIGTGYVPCRAFAHQIARLVKDVKKDK